MMMHLPPGVQAGVLEAWNTGSNTCDEAGVDPVASMGQIKPYGDEVRPVWHGELLPHFSGSLMPREHKALCVLSVCADLLHDRPASRPLSAAGLQVWHHARGSHRGLLWHTRLRAACWHQAAADPLPRCVQLDGWKPHTQSGGVYRRVSQGIWMVYCHTNRSIMVCMYCSLGALHRPKCSSLS
jgi:hypothetical protein